MNLYNLGLSLNEPDFILPSLAEYSKNKYDLFQSYVNYNSKLLKTQDRKKMFFEKCKSNPLTAYIGMLTFTPEIDYNFTIDLFPQAQQLSLPDSAAAGLVLRYVHALIAAKKVPQAYYEEFQQSAKLKPSVFSVPYLCLCARTGQPTTAKFQPMLKSSRLSCLLLFYQGLNDLLLNKFVEAEDSFFKALSITNFAKDIIPNLLLYLGLSNFLLGRSYDYFSSFVPVRFQVDENIKNLWDPDLKYSTPLIFRRWEKQIMTQRAKVIIRDYALLYPSISLEELKSKCSIGDEFDAVFKSIAEDIGAQVEGKKVIFGPPHITSKIEQSIKSIQAKRIAFEAKHQ